MCAFLKCFFLIIWRWALWCPWIVFASSLFYNCRTMLYWWQKVFLFLEVCPQTVLKKILSIWRAIAFIVKQKKNLSKEAIKTPLIISEFRFLKGIKGIFFYRALFFAPERKLNLHLTKLPMHRKKGSFTIYVLQSAYDQKFNTFKWLSSVLNTEIFRLKENDLYWPLKFQHLDRHN